MKIYYLANVRLPTEKAHGIQIMKMCEAFALLNLKSQISDLKSSHSKIEVELVAPRRLNKIKDDPFAYYGVQLVFKITKLPCADLISLSLGSFGFLFETISFLIAAKIYLFFKKYDILYTREALTGLFFKNFVLEVHSLPREITNFHKKIWRRAKTLIVLTNFIKEKLMEAGISGNKILVAPDAVDLEKFDIKILKKEARQKLNLPQDKKIILYTGHLYEWKGASVLLEAAKQSQISNFKSQILFVFVGGTEKDVKKFKSQISNLKNIVVVGHRPHQEIPYWLKAADVLVLPNSAKEKISQFYTSPLKLFEYMASGVPIVASDLPSIREILNESSAVLVEPDNPKSLADGIMKILKNPDFSDKLSKQAYSDVRNYAWQSRAEKIINFINNQNV